jgi:two-component system chemotaxis sensor kinase CheA
VRNALDHGIEAPAQREAAGKSPAGSITLRARHEGNRLVVEVQDDGAGVDLAAVRSRAVERGLISGAEAETLSERATLELLFESGFSTASALTAMSGRGVGLDAARRRVELLGGRMELTNHSDAGTVARIELPLTTAIVKALMVRVGDELYALPIGYVQEIIRARRDEIETIEGREVLDRRGEALSLVDLSRVVGLDRAYPEGGFHVVVVGTEGRSLGVVVEAIGERHEIVIKGMGERLAAVEGVAGAAIGGDGGVVMVLDIAGMLREVECSEELAG